MIIRLIRLMIIALAVLSAKSVFSQPDRNGYHIQHYTDEDGLPQNSIHNVLFDDNGFLWLTSQLGLVRFDGNSFKVYDGSTLPGVASGRIQYLGNAANGNIYFQTDDNRLFLFDEKKDTPLILCNEPLAGKPRLLNDKKQIFNFEGFLTGHDPGGQPGERADIFKDLCRHPANFYPTDSIHTYLSYNDSIYYYDGLRLVKLLRTGDQATDFLLLGNRFYILKQGWVLCSFENGAKTGDKQVIEGIGGGLEKERNAKERDVTVSRAETPFRFYAGKTPHLLVNKKLYRIRKGADGKLFADFLLDLDFLNNVSDIEYNAALDLLLVSTETEGFCLIGKDKFHSPHFAGPLKNLLSNYLFGPIALNKNNSILTSRFIFNAAGQYSLLGNVFPSNPKCLFIDSRNHVWSSISNLIREYSPGFQTVKNYPTVDTGVVDFKEDSLGNLYCLTGNSLWQLKNGSFRLLFDNKQLSIRGTNECLGLGVPGKCWIGNTNGLIEYDLLSNKAALISAIGNAHIRSIYKCKDGSVLIGSYGQGYTYYRRGHFFKMPIDKNDFLVTAHCFLEDNKGFVWISCNKGLFQVSKPDMDAWCDSSANRFLYYYRYGRQDGLKTNEFNGGVNNCGLIAGNGLVTLLSMKGMVCLYADSMKPDLPGNPLFVSNIEVNGKSVHGGDSLKLQPDYNSLVFGISCPFMGNRNNLYLKYCLNAPQEGLQENSRKEEWLDVPVDGKIKFNRLQPGDYTLRIRKMNGFGINNYSYKNIQIRIIPYYYQTPWFSILAAVLAILLLVVFIQLRLTLVQKKKEVSVKAEKLKGTVKALEDTVDKLRESQKALLHTNRLREKLISLVIHDLRSPIRFLSLLANDLHDNLSSFSESEKKERTYWIKKGTNDIYNFSEDFLLWATSQKENFNLVKRNFFIKPLLQEIHDFYKEQVVVKGNTILYEAPDDLMLHSDPHILITIIRNLVDNANKYTEKGSIVMRSHREADHVVISINDTGKGMSPDQINMFLKNDGLQNIKSGSQLGHKFVFDLAKRIDAVITIESVKNIGTSVKLSFPIEWRTPAENPG